MEKLAILLILVLIASGTVQGRMMMPNLLVKQLQMENELKMAMQDMSVKENVNVGFQCAKLSEHCGLGVLCCPGLMCDFRPFGFCVVPSSGDFK